MSPSSGEAAQTPEPKTSSGFASVFKSLTGSKASRNNAQSPVSSQKSAITLVEQSHHGLPDFERFCRQLTPGNATQDRISAAEALRFAVQDYPLEGVTSIFNAGKDLIEPSNSKEARVVGYELLTACVKHEASSEPERLAYFKVITGTAHPEDFHLQLDALIELARHGKDLSGFHYEILPLLTQWLQTSFSVTAKQRKHAGRQQRATKVKVPVGEETSLSLLFAFIVDVIKFSFNVSSTETTGALLDVVLYICINTPLTGDLKACVGVIDAVVTYGDMPSDKLIDCVKVLCSIHCLVSDVQHEAWRSIRNFCKSHHGQTTVMFLLDILRNPPTDLPDSKQMVREIRGAISVLGKIFSKDGKEGYPLVPFSLLMQALTQVVAIQHTKIENDVLQLVSSLLDDDTGERGVKTNVMEEDWPSMFEVVLKCSQRILDGSEGPTIGSRSRVGSPLGKEDIPDQNLTSSIANILHDIIVRVEELLLKFNDAEFFQREDCVEFLISVPQYLPESTALLVIDHYITSRYCYPSDENFATHIRTLLAAFLTDRTQPTQIRLQALKAATDAFSTFKLLDETKHPGVIDIHIKLILEGISEEKDIAVLQDLVSFAVNTAESADEPVFKWIIEALKSNIVGDRLQSPLGSPPGSRQTMMGGKSVNSFQSPSPSIQTPSSVVTKGLIHIFMKTMDRQGTKALCIFDDLLWIARANDYEIDARISALKMLFRLRADWANRVFLTPFTESDGLAASLYRTQASLTRKQAADDASFSQKVSRSEEANSPRISRSTSLSQGQPGRAQPFRLGSGMNRALQRNHQMWMSPDLDALPEQASGQASHTLSTALETNSSPSEHTHDQHTPSPNNLETVPIESHLPDGEQQSTSPNNVGGQQASLCNLVVIDISRYLETIINLMHGCDWEVYSYILVHLPSQLTNQALFNAAIPQIKALRSVLCDQIKNNSFQEPPISSGLRKADVGICLFQILNMVMSYHKHFTKAEDDEMVQTFIRGVGERTSKSCIHALTICCHELPMSTSRNLVSLLQKMSQIITQSHVAVHILEFLACLTRLPHVYVNFREEEYRIVFAICFRYLEYVRDQNIKEPSHRNSQQSGRMSVASTDTSRGLPYSGESNFQPNTSDDLPQYVYALAYHVIIFWFLSLRLEDRAAQVSWITKNLVSTDVNGKETIDEQAQVTLDFMQRTAYADIDESGPDPDFVDERFGKINKSRWVVGNTILTIEQLHSGDWAQITKRQPSGTSSYIIREKYNQRPSHQIPPTNDAMRKSDTPELVLPSHLLVQIIAGMPQSSCETFRPLPLPMDDNMDRSVKMLDRIFTVDSHKVGVIYIGENQSEEVEILANESGSSDYTEFLHGLGTVVPLKGAKFNTQGLDREGNADGEFAICWRDRVTEIVFHATTEMPTNLDNDPQCIMKKRHIGNDFVNIIFNNSGLPFRFDTFPSEFNYVNIVITPESRETFLAARNRGHHVKPFAFYKVQVMSKPGFPEISPAAETKIIGLEALPGFIRLLALNASVFSLVWSSRHGGESVSSWRARLREINRIRERYTAKSTPSSMPTSPPSSANSAVQDTSKVRDSLNSLRRSSVANFLTSANKEEIMISQRSSMLSMAETEVGPASGDGSLIDTLDFSRWASR